MYIPIVKLQKLNGCDPKWWINNKSMLTGSQESESNYFGSPNRLLSLYLA